MALLSELKQRLPGVTFVASQEFYWSPAQRTIMYNANALKAPRGQWALLHEAAHAKLGHEQYETDFELLMMEVAAWQAAQDLAKALGITIDPNHLQDCLDTYRDWLHQRSTCPVCAINCLQTSPTEYRCHNCYTEWTVSSSRFCRPYRRRKTHLPTGTPAHPAETTFA